MVGKGKYEGLIKFCRTETFGHAWRRFLEHHSGSFTSFGHVSLCVWKAHRASWAKLQEVRREIFTLYL